LIILQKQELIFGNKNLDIKLSVSGRIFIRYAQSKKKEFEDTNVVIILESSIIFRSQKTLGAITG